MSNLSKNVITIDPTENTIFYRSLQNVKNGSEMLHISVPVAVIRRLGLKEKQRVAVRIIRENDKPFIRIDVV